MNTDPGNKWQQFKLMLLFKLAALAVRSPKGRLPGCGIPMLYWQAPLEWEQYFSEGEPMTAEIWLREETE